MSEAKFLFSFKGQSGCQVDLVERDGSRRVRKSGRGSAALRLRSQHAKMLRLGHLHAARVPPVMFDEGDEDFFAFEMHYCEMARTFADAAEDMTLFELRGVAEILIKLLQEIEATPATGPIETFGRANARKLESLLHEDGVQRYPAVHGLLERIAEEQGERFKEIAAMPSAFCHGDLTMDNLLWDRIGHHWLIDPIECYFEHPWLDVAKLFQDLEGGWYQMRNHVAQRRASSNLWRIGSLLKDWVGARWPRYGDYHYYLLGLTFTRILPYARDPELGAAVSQRAQTYLADFSRGKKL